MKRNKYKRNLNIKVKHRNRNLISAINLDFFYKHKKIIIAAFSVMIISSLLIIIFISKPTVANAEIIDIQNNTEITSNASDIFYDKLVSNPNLLATGDSIPLIYDEYEIISGDNASFIAQRTGASLDTVISVNKITNAHIIIPGSILKIPNRNGLLYTVKKNDESFEQIADRYSISLLSVLKVNEIENENSIEEGMEIFLPAARYTIDERIALYGLSFFTPLYYYRVSSQYGYRIDPFTKTRALHRGIDFAAPTGTAILAARGGTVTFSGYSGGYGLLVIIRHNDEYTTYYGHMHKSYVKVGQKVAMGQTIGEVGSTGRSTGPHLHFEIRKYGSPVDPRWYVSLK